MSGGAAIRILVADDNEINRRLMGRMLEYKGFEVRTVCNGAEVLDALEKDRYDLVVMDCLMPVVDGFSATRAIRASRSGKFDPDIPVLAITALAGPGDRQKCLESGMTDYISKPVVAERLFQKVREFVSRADRSLPAADPESGPVKDAFPHDILEALSDRLIADIAAWLAQLDRLESDAAFPDIGRLAHTIRGAADVFGASKLSRAAALLEEALRSGQVEGVHSLATALRHELVSLERKIRNDP